MQSDGTESQRHAFSFLAPLVLFSPLFFRPRAVEKVCAWAQHFKIFIANKLCSIFFSAIPTTPLTGPALWLIYCVVAKCEIERGTVLIDGFCWMRSYALFLCPFSSSQWAPTCVQLTAGPFDIFIRQTKQKQKKLKLGCATFTFHGRISGCKKKTRKKCLLPFEVRKTGISHTQPHSSHLAAKRL